MADIKVGLADFVSCPICFETDGDPKILPCDHTYCAGCLQNMLDKARETDITHGRQPVNQITCPQCRLTVDIPDGKKDNLPTNLRMRQLRQVIAGHGHEDKKTYNCKVCDYGRDIETFCTDCNMSMCAACSDIHSKRAIFKDHTFRNTSVLCHVHKHPCMFTCTDCQIILCLSCVNEGICEAHDIKDIAELSNDIITKTDNHIEDIQKHIDESKEKIANKTKIIRDLENDVKISQSDIASMKDLLLTTKDVREKGVEQMILATPDIMAQLPVRKKKTVSAEAVTQVVMKQPRVSITQRYTLTKPATLVWTKEINSVCSIVITPDNYLVALCNESQLKKICMYDTQGKAISKTILDKVTPFGLAHDPYTSSVVVACGVKGLVFYSDTDLKWKQDLVLQSVVDHALSACGVGVLSNSNLVVTTVTVGTDDTIGIYDRQGTMLNMITKYYSPARKQLHVCKLQNFTVLKDDTLVVIMGDQVVYLDGDLQCRNIVNHFNKIQHLDVENLRHFPLDVCTSPDGTTAYLSLEQTYKPKHNSFNFLTGYSTHSLNNVIHLFPDRYIAENGDLDLKYKIDLFNIRDGRLAVVYKSTNAMKMFKLYMKISSKKTKAT